MPRPYKRIATEEAYMTPLLGDLYKRGIERGDIKDPGFVRMWSSIFTGASPFLAGLTDIGPLRLAEMDKTGIDMHLLSQTAPGLQVLDRDSAVGAMPEVNDYLAEAIARHPTRFAGLCSIAPQDPAASAKEIERCRHELKLGGVMINSHTNGEWLDEEKFWPIFEAAQANDMTIYIHPQTPRPGLSEFLRQGMELAFYGFAVEVSTHMLAIIASGALDRFPKLRFVLGHLGEGLPYWLYRFDYMQWHLARPGIAARPEPRALELKVSEYIRRNVWATTSGMPAPEPIRFAQQQIGEDHVLYAMDYPYQNEMFEVAMTEEALTDANRKPFWEDIARDLFHIDGEVGA
ncbi:MAG: amidohydrolase family protein [Allosphingosinicella sp.]